jgi:predicted metalloprotease
MKFVEMFVGLIPAAVIIMFMFFRFIYGIVEDSQIGKTPTKEEKQSLAIKDVRKSCREALQVGVSYEEITNVIDQEIIRDVHQS